MSQHVIKGHIPLVTVTTQLGCAGRNRTSDTPVPEHAGNFASTCEAEEGGNSIQKSVNLRDRITKSSREVVVRVSTETGGKGRPSFKMCNASARVHTTRNLDMASSRVEAYSADVYFQGYAAMQSVAYSSHPQYVFHVQETENVDERVIIQIR